MNRLNKTVVSVFPLLAAALCGWRIAGCFLYTEPETGFYTGSELLGACWWILLAAGCLLRLFLAGRPELLPTGEGSPRLRGVALLAASLCGIWETVVLCLELKDQTFRSGLESVPFILRWGMALLAVVTLVLWFRAIVSLLRGINPVCPAGLAALPALWLVLRGLFRYLDAQIAVTVPQIVLSILAMLTLTLWWCEYGRIWGRVNPEKGRKLLSALTPVTAALLLIAGLSALAEWIAGVNPPEPADLTDLLMTAFVLLTGRREKIPASAGEPEETEA